MPPTRRIDPLDLASLSVLAVALCWAGLHLLGARWTSGAVGGGFRKLVHMRVAVVAPDAVAAAVAGRLRPGAFPVETSWGREQVEIESLTPTPQGLRVELVLAAYVDRDGRAFFDRNRLRAGEPFVAGDGRIVVNGIVVEASAVEAARP